MGKRTVDAKPVQIGGESAAIVPGRPGRPTKITAQIAQTIADMLCRGVPLRYACALQNPPFSASHFEQALAKQPYLALCTDKRVGENMLKFLDIMNDPETKLRGMPASVWIWERRFAEHFAPPKQGGGNSVTINNNTTVIGVEEQVAARVASMVRELGKSAPKQLKQAAAIDIESEHSRK